MSPGCSTGPREGAGGVPGERGEGEEGGAVGQEGRRPPAGPSVVMLAMVDAASVVEPNSAGYRCCLGGWNKIGQGAAI